MALKPFIIKNKASKPINNTLQNIEQHSKNINTLYRVCKHCPKGLHIIWLPLSIRQTLMSCFIDMQFKQFRQMLLTAKASNSNSKIWIQYTDATPLLPLCRCHWRCHCWAAYKAVNRWAIAGRTDSISTLLFWLPLFLTALSNGARYKSVTNLSFELDRDLNEGSDTQLQLAKSW